MTREFRKARSHIQQEVRGLGDKCPDFLRGLDSLPNMNKVEDHSYPMVLGLTSYSLTYWLEARAHVIRKEGVIRMLRNNRGSKDQIDLAIKRCVQSKRYFDSVESVLKDRLKTLHEVINSESVNNKYWGNQC